MIVEATGGNDYEDEGSEHVSTSDSQQATQIQDSGCSKSRMQVAS